MNWLDGIIGFISPEWGARREAWRQSLTEMNLLNLVWVNQVFGTDDAAVWNHLFDIKTPVATYNMIPDSQVFEIELVA